MKSRIMENLEQNLGKLGSEKSAKQYLSDSIKISVLVFVFAWLGWNLIMESAIEGLGFSLIVTGISLGIMVSKPGKDLDKKARKIEKHLPFALMQLSIDLNTGTHFEKALERVSKGNYGELSKELRKGLKSAKESGLSTPGALLRMASKNNSKELNRITAQLVSIYEHGTKKSPGEIIRRMALEQLSKQKSAAKEYSGKVIIFSLAFISLSAIVPALFQAFTIVGSSFMEIPFTAIQILLIVGVFFPLIDVLMLLFIKSSTPEFLKG